MTKAKKPKKPAVGKQIDNLIAERIKARALFQSHNLAGGSRNSGVKNIGPQQKKGSRGDR